MEMSIQGQDNRQGAVPHPEISTKVRYLAIPTERADRSFISAAGRSSRRFLAGPAAVPYPPAASRAAVRRRTTDVRASVPGDGHAGGQPS